MTWFCRNPGLPSGAGAQAASRARRVRRLSGRDKVVLGLMVGIPTLIQLVLVWIPTLMSVGLCFTRWNGLELTDIKPAGVENYQFISQDYPPFWPAMQHNVLWLAFLALVATPLGLLLAVLLDQHIRGTQDLPEHLLRPGDAVPGPDRDHLAAVLQPGQRPPELPARHRGHAPGRRLVRGFQRQHLGSPLRRHLAARRLRHDPVPGRAQGRGSDPASEAAQIDGANAVQTFFRVVFPAMRPVNVIIIVITVIESLRAFDIVYVINRGTNGLELISALVIQNLVGEGQVIGIGSALAVILLVISLVPITFYLARTFGKEKEA